MLSFINFETRNLKLFEYVRKVRNSQLGFLFTQKQVCDTYSTNGMLVCRNLRKIHGFSTCR